MIFIIYKMREKSVVIFHVYDTRAIFYYSVITKTTNLSIDKWKLAYLNKY